MEEGQDFLAEAQQVRDEQTGGVGSPQVDPAVQGAVDHAQQTAGAGPEPGSQQPGFMGLGGLSSADIEAQKQDIAQQRYAAPAGEVSESAAPSPMAGTPDAGASEADFMAAAQNVRDEQTGGAGSPQVDPAVQGAVDHAQQTAGAGPEPGSQEPGFMGLGGLSSADIEAQKEDIARTRHRGD